MTVFINPITKKSIVKENRPSITKDYRIKNIENNKFYNHCAVVFVSPELDLYEFYTDNKLEPCFIEKYQNYLQWGMLIHTQVIPEHLIEKFQNKLFWCEIARHQPLSKAFIQKFIHQLDFDHLKQNLNISQEDKIFIEKLFLLK